MRKRLFMRKRLVARKRLVMCKGKDSEGLGVRCGLLCAQCRVSGSHWAT